MLRQEVTHALAYVADAKSKEHASERLLLGMHQLIHDFFGGFAPHRNRITRMDTTARIVRRIRTPCLEGCNVIYRKLVEVGHIVHEARLEHLIHQLVADAIHVHAAAAHPVQQALFELCCAVKRYASIGNLALFVYHRAAAHRTGNRHLPRQSPLGTFIHDRTHNLGNYVARLVYHDRVAHAHVLAVHLVNVMERGARDSRTSHGHGVKLRHRSEHTRTTNLHANLAQHGGFLLGRELKRNGPTRSTRRKAQLVLLSKRVDLHHHTIDVVVKIAAMLQRVRAKSVHLSRGDAGSNVGVHVEARTAKPGQKLTLTMHVKRRCLSSSINEGREVTLGCYPGILLTQRTSCGVARIGKGIATSSIGLIVQAHKTTLGHIDLAAHLNGAITVCAHVDKRRL